MAAANAIYISHINLGRTPVALPFAAGAIPGTKLEEEAEFQRVQSATDPGRTQAFGRFMANMRGGMPLSVQQALERQGPRYGDIYNIQQGLGDIPGDETFTQFLGRQGELGRPDPSVLNALVGRARETLSPDFEEARLSDEWSRDQRDRLRTFREDLSGDLSRQQQMALRAAEQGVPMQLRDSLRRLGSRNLSQFNLAQGLGKTGSQSFLDFINEQGTPMGLSGSRDPSEFRALAEETATLFNTAPPTTGLRQTTLEGLEKSPESQFDIALNYQLPNIPAPMRNAFRDMAFNQFQQWQNDKGTFANFLPMMSQRNWNFAPNRG
jgi:hypothetical protein